MSKDTVDITLEQDAQETPIVAVVSDSRGKTATSVVEAAMAQFDPGCIVIKKLLKVRNINDIKDFLDHDEEGKHTRAVFHTVIDDGLRGEIRDECAHRGIPSMDLIGPAISVVSAVTGTEPKNIPGVLSNSQDRFYRREDALGFYSSHDDGEGAGSLNEADIVLVGPPKTQKSPLALYMAFAGVKVASIDIEEDVELPAELAEVPTRRIIGLTRTVESLSSPTTGNSEQPLVAEEDLEQYTTYLKHAKKRLKKLGCEIIVIDGKTIEELGDQIFELLRRDGGHVRRADEK